MQGVSVASRAGTLGSARLGCAPEHGSVAGDCTHGRSVLGGLAGTGVYLLAAHLGAKTYSVVGVSGGGPYALACAYAFPAEELKSVSLVCGFGPYALTVRRLRCCRPTRR